MTSLTSKPRSLRYPSYVREQFAGRSRGFRAFHRKALREAARALNEARRGASWSGDADLIRTAQHAIDDAIEMCSVKNWEGRR